MQHNDDAGAEQATEYITPKQAAEYTNTTESFWERLRATGRGPAYVKLGNSRTSIVRYRRSDVDAWLADHMRRSTFDSRPVAA